MWKSCAREKYKVFFWLLLHDRLNTQELLRKKNMDLQNHSCVLCTRNVKENLMHIFFECPFSKWCWRFVNIHWNTSLSPQDMLNRRRRQFVSRILREVIMMVCWTIWCHTNVVIFDATPVSLDHWKEAFKDEFRLVIHRASSKTKSLLSDWLSNFSRDIFFFFASGYGCCMYTLLLFNLKKSK
jgi:hypothetical protein